MMAPVQTAMAFVALVRIRLNFFLNFVTKWENKESLKNKLMHPNRPYKVGVF